MLVSSGRGDDWRVEIDPEESGFAARLRERVESRELSDDAKQRLAGGAVVSNDGDRIFIYTGSRDAARTAEQVVADIAREHGITVKTEVTHWHEAAEDWESLAVADAQTPEEVQAEHARLMRRETQEAAEQGYSDWEVRVQYPSHTQAHELSERLDAEGVPHIRRWKYVLIGATDEEAAEAWCERLRKEAGPSAEVETEGTFVSVARANPWRTVEEAGGGP